MLVLELKLFSIRKKILLEFEVTILYVDISTNNALMTNQQDVVLETIYNLKHMFQYPHVL
jgi:hypothetical protein